jgi:hypothetical protein
MIPFENTESVRRFKSSSRYVACVFHRCNGTGDGLRKYIAAVGCAASFRESEPLECFNSPKVMFHESPDGFTRQIVLSGYEVLERCLKGSISGLTGKEEKR